MVSRQGYDSTGTANTQTDRHVVTSRVRQPYPNQASWTTADVALSEYVYSTDTISGVTNNSAEVSPKPVANWVMPARQVVGNAVTLEVVAFHRDGVACVEFTGSDGTTTVTQKVSATVVSGRTGDRHAVLVYRATLDLTTLADNALVTVNAKVYPRIGTSGSIADSSLSTVKREFSSRHFLKNVALAASPPYAYVAKAADVPNGVGTPSSAGVVSTNLATARATPFDTVLNAINAIHTAYSATTGVDGCEVVLGNDAGTPHVLGSTAATRTQKCGVLTITRDPNVAKANARASWGAAAFRSRLGGALLTGVVEAALQFRDVALVRTGTSVLQGETVGQLQLLFDNCDIDGFSSATTWLSNSHAYHYGTTFTNTPSTPVSAGIYEQRIFRGISWQPATVSGGNQIESWLILGSSLKNAVLSRGARSRSGAIITFNDLPEQPWTTPMLAIASDEDVTGFVFSQNLTEWTAAFSNFSLGVSPDGTTGNNTHVILWNNTYAGAFGANRWNSFYDEGTTRRTSKLMSVKGNIAVQINTKSDVMRGQNQAGPDASVSIGNWSFEYGVGCQGNFSQYIDANSGGIGSSFAQDYPGLGCSIGTSADTATRNNPLFTSDQAVTVASGGTVYTAGAGGGTYTLQSGSPCKGMVAARVLSHDLAGTARLATGDTAGAYA